MNLAALIPDSDYQFQMRFDRGSVAEFFAPGPQHDLLLRERRYWLNADARTYAALLAEGTPLVGEVLGLAPHVRNELPHAIALTSSFEMAWNQMLALGANWEPDFILLGPTDDGTFRVVAGCVCFPSSWSLVEKIGRTIDEVHGPVPGLNETIGKPIGTFLSKLKPGSAWLRHNWGLSRSAELNQHPDRFLPRLDASATEDTVWVRVESQLLSALPRSRGVLFGIRISMHSLAELRSDIQARSNLKRALETMPAKVADYKGLTQARDKIIKLLAD